MRFSGAGGWVARPVSLHRFISSDDACARHGTQKFASPNAFTTGADFKAYLRETFDALYSEGAAGSPKMMSVGLHCRLAGRPGRAAALAETRSEAAVDLATVAAVAGSFKRVQYTDWSFTYL
eukprot:COSAG02_NODE_8264_length_2638_cov_1.376920_1_plen_122_part_00